MKAIELVEILLQNPDKEVYFAIGDGGNTSTLPVETVEIFNNDILLDCKWYGRENVERRLNYENNLY